MRAVAAALGNAKGGDASIWNFRLPCDRNVDGKRGASLSVTSRDAFAAALKTLDIEERFPGPKP